MVHFKTLLTSAATAAATGLLLVAFHPATPTYAADLYPYGQCTYYAKSVRTDVGNYWGNAKYWASSARAAGFPVSSQPRVGDVVVFGAYVQGNSPYGHVGIVTAVQGSQFKVISMWGNEATGRIHVNWHHTGGGVSFIHKKGTTVARAPAKKSTPAVKAPAKKPAAVVKAPAKKPASKAAVASPKKAGTSPATKRATKSSKP